MTFTSAIIGGLFLGTSVFAYMVFNGRVLGFSGVCGGLIKSLCDPCSAEEDRKWRVAFTLGTVLGGAAVTAIIGSTDLGPGFVVPEISASVMLFAGLLVGVGTRLANGCTSGHGLCGLSRLSPRSLVAVPTFILSGMITTTIMNNHAKIPKTPTHVPAVSPWHFSKQDNYALLALIGVWIVLLAVSITQQQKSPSKTPNNRLIFLSHLFLGVVAATGLVLSGMTNSHKVLAFLSLPSYLFNFSTLKAYWAPSMMLVMASGMLPNIPLYFSVVKKMKKPVLENKLRLPTNNTVNKELIIGSILFGIGWGAAGICPGPFFANLLPSVVSVSQFLKTVMWGSGFTAGILMGDKIKTELASGYQGLKKEKTDDVQVR